MRKNPTPGYIALISSALVSGLILLASYILSFDFWDSIWLTLIAFIGAFGVFYFLLDRFIYRKIKLIYKTIYNQKIHKYSNPSRITPITSDPISEVQEEVVNWAKSNIAEIEQLKKQESYRREFLGNVSHELKTPIFNIQGYIHTLLDGALKDEKVNEKFLKRASDNIDRLVELVGELTSISNLESGELKLNFTKFDLHALAKGIIENLELKAKEKGVKITFKEGCNRPFFVNADKPKIRQVLTNLIENAIKYGNEGGHVLIGFYDMDKLLLTEVSDNGEGIEEIHIPRLFERFYRVEKSRSRDAGGSGLGLAIVKHIIEAHDQVINARSAVGIGTTFGFTLKKG
jgi:two-component system phosphate regulon sensor histidine kinase PhoR